MAGTTDFVPFATATGAHVTAQATYIAEATTATGFVPGVASSYDCNKVWRQATFIAAGLATYVANQLNTNIPDNGNLSGFVTNLTAAIQVPITAAQTAAEAYAATVAGNAQTNAETFATNAANTAQTNSEVYAAAQASTAQTNAQNFATTKANTAQSNAETYAAAEAAIAQSNAETYAAAQANAAQANAENYALVAAINAQSAAETYSRGTVTLGNPMRVVLPSGATTISGVASLAAGANSVSMGAGFASQCISIVMTPYGSGAQYYVTSHTTNSFTCNVGVAQDYFWQATGY